MRQNSVENWLTGQLCRDHLTSGVCDQFHNQHDHERSMECVKIRVQVTMHHHLRDP